MAKKKSPPAPAAVPVDALTHPAASRVNIPSRETAPFADTPVGKAVYTRDPALDPQLVWKQKGHADTLEVPAVPVYVQEKVHPRHIIDDLKARAAAGRPPTCSPTSTGWTTSRRSSSSTSTRSTGPTA